MKLTASAVILSALFANSVSAETPIGSFGTVTEKTELVRKAGNMTPFGSRPGGSQCYLLPGDGIEVIGTTNDGLVMVRQRFKIRGLNRTRCSMNDAGDVPSTTVDKWLKKFMTDKAEKAKKNAEKGKK